MFCGLTSANMEQKDKFPEELQVIWKYNLLKIDIRKN